MSLGDDTKKTTASRAMFFSRDVGAIAEPPRAARRSLELIFPRCVLFTSSISRYIPCHPLTRDIFFLPSVQRFCEISSNTGCIMVISCYIISNTYLGANYILGVGSSDLKFSPQPLSPYLLVSVLFCMATVLLFI
jgi:hypothetical protein